MKLALDCSTASRKRDKQSTRVAAAVSGRKQLSVLYAVPLHSDFHSLSYQTIKRLTHLTENFPPFLPTANSELNSQLRNEIMITELSRQA